MTIIHRPNIFKLLESEFKVFDSVIDIGCAGLQDLVDFEYSEFKKLIGVDKHFCTNDFGDYRRVKLKDKELTDEQSRLISSELLKDFMERFIIYNKDFNEIEWDEVKYSFIICNKVLHFYSEEKKFQLLKKFHDSLQQGGMIYLTVNHNLHPDNTNLTKVTRIGQNVYQNNEVPEDIRYLVDPDSFIRTLQKNYQVLEKYTSINKKTVTVVLRK